MEIQLVHTLTNAQADQLHTLYQAEWWTRERTREEIDTMLAFSDLIFGFCERATGRLVAFARVLTDRVFKALIFDVIVEAPYRNRGFGEKLMDALFQHPALAVVQHVELYCLPEMVPFYEKWGFTDALGRLRLMRRDQLTAGYPDG